MYFIENIRVGQQRAETRLRAEIDRPSAILGAGKVGGISVAKNPTAQGHKLVLLLLLPENNCWHIEERRVAGPPYLF